MGSVHPWMSAKKSIEVIESNVTRVVIGKKSNVGIGETVGPEQD